MCAQRRASRIKRGRTVTDSHKQHTCVFVLSLTQDPCVLFSPTRQKRTHPWSGVCACICSSPPPPPHRHKCINILPPSRSLTAGKGSTDTTPKRAHDTRKKWGTARAPHSKTKRRKLKTKNTTSYSCFGPLRSAVRWSKWLFSWFEADGSFCTRLLCPWKGWTVPSRVGPSPSHLLPVRVEEPGALHRPSCDHRANRASQPASVHPKLKAWHTAWRSANSANLGSLSVCVCVNSAGEGSSALMSHG